MASRRAAELDNKNKDKINTESYIYKIINKAKTLFSKNHNEEEANAILAKIPLIWYVVYRCCAILR